MNHVRPCEVPLDSLLQKYRDGPGFSDGYVTEVQAVVTQAAYVEAFYTSALFRIERSLLGLLASRPASDADARRLAMGKTDQFSAWSVEARSPTELLLVDFTGRTRSWLMAVPGPAHRDGPTTLLYFGSAVVPRRRRGGAQTGMGWMFHALLGFHRLYSRLLLCAASGRLRRA